MEGAVLLYRGILDSQVFAHQTALKIWIWCLCRATWKERYVPFNTNRGEKVVKLLPGQFIFGRYKAEEELGIDGSTIYKWIQKFASPDFGMIEIESNNKYSIITICKWNDYQVEHKKKVTAKEQHSNSGVTTEEQHSNTNNKVNTVYNVYYDSEILKSNNDLDYIEIVSALFGKNNLGVPLSSVLKMETQLSYEQFQRMQAYKRKYTFGIIQLLEEMENWKGIKDRKVVYSTFQTFLKNYLKIKNL